MEENHEQLLQDAFESHADTATLTSEVPIREDMGAAAAENSYSREDASSPLSLDEAQALPAPCSLQCEPVSFVSPAEQSFQAPCAQAQTQFPQDPYMQYPGQTPADPYPQYAGQIPGNPYVQYSGQSPANPYMHYNGQSPQQGYIPPYHMRDPRMPLPTYPQNAPGTVNGYRVYRPMAVSKKQRKGLASLILGMIAMALAYVIPALAISLGIIAVVFGVGCVKKGQEEHTQRVMGALGLFFGSLAVVGSLVIIGVTVAKLFRLAKALMPYGINPV